MRIYVNQKRVFILAVITISTLALTLVYMSQSNKLGGNGQVFVVVTDAAARGYRNNVVKNVDELTDSDEFSEKAIRHRKKLRSEELFPEDVEFFIRTKSSTVTTATADESDAFKDLLVKKGSSLPNKYKGKVCKEKRNFVFIKTMKCATQTLVQIFRRFGYLRQLNFVLPRRENIYLGWPFIMEKRDYLPSKRKFNALVEHSVYNKTVMSKMFPKDTAYLTILREPFSHFKSAFNYFNVANISKVKVKPDKDQITEYFRNIDKYETFYKSPEGSSFRYCIPDGFSVTKNMLSHCLGMPLGFPEDRRNITTNASAVSKYISDLANSFKLVMIMEYFHESLVLLKRLMCWSMKDILYRFSNMGNYLYKHTEPNSESLNLHRHWSSVDYQLYNHFNKTFWKKILQEGDDFSEEVNVYTAIQEQVTEYCKDIPKTGESLHVPATSFSAEIVISPDYCLMLGVDLLTYLRTRYHRQENWTESEGELAIPKRCC